MKILFVDGSHGKAYDGQTVHERALGGISTAVCELARALEARGHGVAVANRIERATQGGGIRWLPLRQLEGERADVVVANNDAQIFRFAKKTLERGAIPVLWSHNRIRWKRVLVKGDLYEMVRWRPFWVFLGARQAAGYPAFLPGRGRTVIRHGVSGIFLDLAPRTEPGPPQAIFTSQPYRGFDQVVRIWCEKVAPNVPGAELHGFVQTDGNARAFDTAELRAQGVFVHDRAPKADIANALREARVMIVPGHRDETFCLAAAEALCVGTPIVTFGIGSLSERVRDGEDGFVVPDEEAFAARTIDILTDDALWRRLHQGALAGRERGVDWGGVAADWERLFEGVLPGSAWTRPVVGLNEAP